MTDSPETHDELLEPDHMPDESAFTTDDVLREEEGVLAPAPKRRRSIFDDPMVRWMAWIAVGLVVLYLVTILSALFLGVLGSSVPQTRVESDIQLYEARTQKSPKDSKVWREYIDALITGGQYSKAQDVIDRATAAVDQKATQDILSAQVDLYFAMGRYKESIKTADSVRTKLKAYYDKAKKESGTPESKQAPISANYSLVLITKAESQVKLGNEAAAIETLSTFLKDNPTAADVFVRRGELLAGQGDKTKAEADFREALKYLPEDEAALEGLKKIGVQQ